MRRIEIESWLTSLPPQDDITGFAVGWAEGHCYYRRAEERSYLIQQSQASL